MLPRYFRDAKTQPEKAERDVNQGAQGDGEHGAEQEWKQKALLQCREIYLRSHGQKARADERARETVRGRDGKAGESCKNHGERGAEDDREQEVF